MMNGGDMSYRSKLKVKGSSSGNEDCSKNNNNNCNNNNKCVSRNNGDLLTKAASFEKSSSAMATAAATPTTTTAAAATAAVVQQQQQQGPPLKKLSLRGNQLCGSILIGNYNYLTQLEVYENEMEILDLSSLAQLETLKCARNKLMELVINGSSLKKLVAHQNCLHTITANPVPLKLIYIDISHNSFDELPTWLGASVMLQFVNASHNQLNKLTGFCQTYRINMLLTLNLAYNCLQMLDRLPEACTSLTELQLQSNELIRMPENLFTVTHGNLRLLNLSCNKLANLPPYELNSVSALEKLYLSGNQLNDTIFDVLIHAPNLKILHVAFNRLRNVPEACLRQWSQLQVLVLSGNMLQHLPEVVNKLDKLEVLCVHSNLLLTTPILSDLPNLSVLDLAHNHLDRINLISLVSKSLKYLDLSDNLQLQVDEQQMKVCQRKSDKFWSLIDVSGRNRAGLPTMHRSEYSTRHSEELKPPWLMGFAETPKNCCKLLVSQLRLVRFRCEDQAVIGMFESVVSNHRTKALAQVLPGILEQEYAVRAMRPDYLKRALLAAQRQIEDREPLSATICHITKEHVPCKIYVRPLKAKRYVLHVLSNGLIGAYLVRRTTNVCLTRGGCDLQVTPHEPEVIDITLSNDDEYLVLGNSKLWSVLDINRVARELRKEENVLLAAKRVQDIAQSFGAMEHLSVLVLRFCNIGTDVEQLIRELKQSVRRKAGTNTIELPMAERVVGRVCKRSCCERSNACHHRAIERPITAVRSERSSPSGQSDQLHKDGSSLAIAAKPPIVSGGDDFVLAHARVLEEKQELEMLDETESFLSEEQFKCWEYMLEQNTQLLFDKELNTISKSFTKNRKAQMEGYDLKTNLMKTVSNKFISHSSPQLMCIANENTKKQLAPIRAYKQDQKTFLSKHFGSSRSFQNGNNNNNGSSALTAYKFLDTKSRESLSPIANPYAKLSGGPNAAYFSSLQRLMPTTLDYDFDATQERRALDEDDETYNELEENCMSKYWGLATTEL